MISAQAACASAAAPCTQMTRSVPTATGSDKQKRQQLAQRHRRGSRPARCFDEFLRRSKPRIARRARLARCDIARRFDFLDRKALSKPTHRASAGAAEAIEALRASRGGSNQLDEHLFHRIGGKTARRTRGKLRKQCVKTLREMNSFAPESTWATDARINSSERAGVEHGKRQVDAELDRMRAQDARAHTVNGRYPRIIDLEGLGRHAFGPQRAFNARFDFTRRFSVNVIAMTCSIPSRNAPPSSAEPSMSAHAIRCVNVNVLPLPAPAKPRAGHRRRDAFQLARFESVEIHAPTPLLCRHEISGQYEHAPDRGGRGLDAPCDQAVEARPIPSSVASSSEENSGRIRRGTRRCWREALE